MHHSLLTDQLKEQIQTLLFHQRILAADAGTRGRCVFYRDELRMPRASLTAQKFTIAQDVAHLSVMPQRGQDFRPLTPNERQTLVEKLMAGEDLTWGNVKDQLGLSDDAIFNIEPAKYKVFENGKEKTKTQRSGTKEKLRGSQTVAQLQAIIGDKWKQLGEQAQRDLVSQIISIRDWTRDAKNHTAPAALRRLAVFRRRAYGPKNEVKFSERECYELATVNLLDGYLNVSLRAAKRILPHMLQDKVYSEACEAAGFDHANPEGELPTLDRLPFPSEQDISHALVRTSVQSAVRVLNALHSAYGKPDAIHIELPRDLAMGAEQREEMERKQKENARERTRITGELAKHGIKPTRANITKVRLWEELGGAALAYEPNVKVSDLSALMNGDYEVDHIVPRSHSLDTTMANLTLCTREFNAQVKGNRTLYEAIGSTPDWERVAAHVRSIKSMPLHKRNRILAKERPDGFTERHLAATGYISREVLKLAQRMVEHKANVLVVPGKATSDFRRFWELDDLVPLHPEEQAAVDAWEAFIKKAEAGQAAEEDVKNAKRPGGKARSNLLHHALDAAVTALTSRSALQAMASYYQLVETHSEKVADKQRRKYEHMRALPDPNLRQKVEEALKRAVIVHRPNRRPNGELHKQQPEENVPQQLSPGKPWSSKVVGKYLVKYDQDGKPAQAYPLESNHHLIIWERTEPNKKGEYERRAEVVTTMEAVRRREHKEPLFRKYPEPGWRFVLSLCKGDMVEMADGRIGVVSKFSVNESGRPDIAVWEAHMARQLGGLAKENPFLIKRISGRQDLALIRARVIMDPLGKIVYREGMRE